MLRKLIMILLAVLCCASCLAEGNPANRLPPAYRPVLELVKRGVAGDEAAMEDERFNTACYFVRIYEDRETGWTLADLDGDGAEELIIGQVPENAADDLWIMDIWTARDGEARLLSRGWERNRMYLTKEEGNVFGLYFEGADSAFESVWTHALIRNGAEAGKDTVICFTDLDTDLQTWTLNDERVAEDRAFRLIDAWRDGILFPELIPLE